MYIAEVDKNNNTSEHTDIKLKPGTESVKTLNISDENEDGHNDSPEQERKENPAAQLTPLAKN